MAEADPSLHPEDAGEDDAEDFIDVDLSEVLEDSTKVPTKVKVIPRWVRHCLCPYICMGRRRAIQLSETPEPRTNDVANNNEKAASGNGVGESETVDGKKGRRRKRKGAKKSKSRNNTACCCCRNICPYICVKRSTALAVNKHDTNTTGASTTKVKRKPKLPVVKMTRPTLKPLHIKPPKPAKKHQAKVNAENHAYVNEAATADDLPAAVPYVDEGPPDHAHNPYLETNAEVDLDSVDADSLGGSASVTSNPDHVVSFDHVTGQYHVTAPTHVPPSPPLEAAPSLPEVDTVSNASTESFLVLELPGA